MARVPEHRDQALRDLQQLTADPKDNEAAHRALARDDLRQKRFDAAADELEKAAELNPRDPWIWYYRAALKYQKAQATRQEMQGLANMMQDLRAVADWYPELADAYNMLEWREWRVAESTRRWRRNGRRSLWRREMWSISSTWDRFMLRGKSGSGAGSVYAAEAGPDRAAAAAAKQQLEDLETLQKYGLRPQRAGESPETAGAARTPAAGAGAPAVAGAQRKDDDEEADASPKPAPVKPGTTGPVQFLKGKIVTSDCSKPPEATVTILSGMTTYKLHASDYKSLLVIGEDQFPAIGKNRLVSVNYRAAGKNEGELVSIETH